MQIFHQIQDMDVMTVDRPLVEKWNIMRLHKLTTKVICQNYKFLGIINFFKELKPHHLYIKYFETQYVFIVPHKIFNYSELQDK